MPKDKKLLPEDLAYRFVQRFAQLVNFPPNEESLGELVRAMRTAPSYEAADLFVREWSVANRDCPKPADIYQTFDPPGRPPALPSIPLVYACDLCQDTGWVTVESMHGNMPVTGAKRCHHPDKQGALI